jgi:hypothetical protein
MSFWKLRQYSGNVRESTSLFVLKTQNDGNVTSNSGGRSGGSGGSGSDGGPTLNGGNGILMPLTRVPTKKQLINAYSRLKEIVMWNSWILRETLLGIFSFIRKFLSLFLKEPHNISFGTTFTQLHGFTTLAYSTLTQAHANTMSSFDTDLSFWVCNNSATGHICNDKAFFHGKLVPSI